MRSRGYVRDLADETGKVRIMKSNVIFDQVPKAKHEQRQEVALILIKKSITDKEAEIPLVPEGNR